MLVADIRLDNRDQLADALGIAAAEAKTMADAAILNGQRVLPAKALSLGYTFRYRQLEEALEALFPVTPTPP